MRTALLVLWCCLSAAIAAAGMGVPRTAGSQGGVGAKVFTRVCAACHEHGVPRAPPVQMLRYMSSGEIYRALTAGAMRLEARRLSDAEKRAVADYLGGGAGSSVGTGAPACHGAEDRFDYGQPPAFPGWGMTFGNTRSIPAATAGLRPANLATLRLKWAMSFPAAQRVRSQPAIAGGALFIGSQNGTVYSLNLATGCVRWEFDAAAEVRTGLVVAPWKAGNTRARPLVYFGDLVGNVYAVNAVTGRLVWQAHPEAHPSATITAAPALYRGRLYVPVSSLEEAVNDPHYACCTFRGLLVAYDARTGRKIWQRYTVPPPVPHGTDPAGALRMGPSGAAIWSSPTIDPQRGQIYIATGDNYSDPTTRTSDAVMALDMATGRIKWLFQAKSGDAWNAGCMSPDRALCPRHAGPDADFGAAPVLATIGGGRQLLLAGQKSGWVYALDPENGRLAWKRRVGRGGIEGGVEFGMAADAQRLFVPINDMTDATYGLHPPGVARPGVYALNLLDGAPLWAAPDDGHRCHGRTFCTGGFESPVTVTGRLVLAGSVDGWLRIYDAATGKVLWRYDTTRPVRTVGGGITRGGSMAGGAGPIAYHHLLIAVSGYDFSNKMPGDALLVFQCGRRATH